MEWTRKCDHCSAVEGKKRPIGRYIVELHVIDFEGELLDLCITCYKHYQRRLVRHSIQEEEKKDTGFYFNFVKFYQNTFHLEKQGE
tara:strand:- start:13630 stop:13887 length:258 start_codon:yes stop_codon:yes gene_type:complete